MDIDALEPIGTEEYLQELIDDGFIIKGLRNDPARDIKPFKAFLKKGKEFAPENWLEKNDYKFVEPNTFTKGHRIAYKEIDNFPDERFNSNYSIVKDGKEVVLYLKTELPENPN